MLIDDEGGRFAPLAENLYVNLIRHARIHTSNILWETETLLIRLNLFRGCSTFLDEYSLVCKKSTKRLMSISGVDSATIGVVEPSSSTLGNRLELVLLKLRNIFLHMSFSRSTGSVTFVSSLFFKSFNPSWTSGPPYWLRYF